MNFTRKELEAIERDRDIEGVFFRDGRTFVDLRYTAEAIGRRGLSPRTADLNVVGLLIREIVVVDENISPTEEGDV